MQNYESRMEHFIRALTTDEQDGLTCQKCQDLLPDYAQAESQGQAHEERWRSVAFHLETCPHCSNEYALLLDLIELAYGEKGKEPPHYPVPDLSFLPKPWFLDELGRLVIKFSTELLPAPRPLTLQPAHDAPRLKSDESSKTLCQFILKEAVKDLEVTISAEEQRDDPNHCTVTVEVNIPSRGGWPHLADTEVSLKRNELELETQRTDAFGKAFFEGIANNDLASLVFEITPHP